MVISNSGTAIAYYEHLRIASGIANRCSVPNLFGVGPGRSGTTFLYGLLSTLDEILVSSVKEANFFGIMQDKYRLGGVSLNDYSRLFSHAKSQSFKYCAEISPVYLFHRPSLDEIRATCGLAKIMVTLRNPIDRAFSQYKHHQQSHQFTNFDHYCQVGLGNMNLNKPVIRPDWFAPQTNLRQSLYSSDIEYCWKLFGKQNVLILHYEELNAERDSWIARVSEFLGLELTAEGQPTKHRNASSKNESMELSRMTNKMLTEFYREDQKELRRLQLSLKD